MVLIQRQTPYPHWEFSDPAGADLLRLVPERGGLITGWRCGGREVLYLDENRFAEPTLSVRGGIPVLFPICGGLPNDTLTLPQGDFRLPQHGFARQMPWTLTALEDGSGVALELTDSPETIRAYPFAFRLTMAVRVAPSALEISTTVENRSEQAMPFSFGLHPYIQVSDLSAVRFEGLPDRCQNHITMAEAATAPLLEQLQAGVDLLVRPSSRSVTLLDQGSGTGLSLELSQPLDLVVIWSEPPRPMVCLEPWSAPRQALLSGDRKLELAPGQQQILHCRYVLSTPAS
jgi:galactose mutarotase-like enzyme